jgi:chromosome segregation ATPase
MKRRVVLFTIPIVGLILGATVRTPAATPAAHEAQATAAAREDVLPALLIEVRGLRAAMEQMAAAGPRVQLALGRVQLQEQRINTLIRRLDEAHAAVVQTQKEYDRLKQQIGELEESIRTCQTAACPPIEEMKGALAHTQRTLVEATGNLQRATAEEGSIASALAGEQARWTDLNQRLEALEAALGAR